MSLFQPTDSVPPWAAAWLAGGASLVAALGEVSPPADAAGVDGLGDALPPQAPITRPSAAAVANHRLVRGPWAMTYSSIGPAGSRRAVSASDGDRGRPRARRPGG